MTNGQRLPCFRPGAMCQGPAQARLTVSRARERPEHGPPTPPVPGSRSLHGATRFLQGLFVEASRKSRNESMPDITVCLKHVLKYSIITFINAVIDCTRIT